MIFPETLTEDNFADGLNFLISQDPDLAKIFTRLGTPPLWIREPGFSTLIQIILEQQVSLASAKAVYTRLQATISPITPELFLQLDDVEIKQIGFSRQKALYARTLAQSIIAGQLDLSSFSMMDDEEIRTVLKKLKGIGDWTVDIYLMMALRRPDSLPKGDLGLILAIQKVKRLEHRPKPAEIELIAEIWRPWRAVATRLLWHYYLNQRRTLI
ncbi:DNA-3-methyladenine glycosylase 2 family protein [Scytonema hofmannii FACHB-248]|uniref:DNA-3-methyladenine glycosylase II n=1 Tax=Scytonema hofmannii FACHB-248 TaxID=1842502 RepID=A0ABR8GY92_9CYAN|nr:MULTISPECIES: DNA-3-methyladenine glycosylase [Nostocales]MBD2608123.1 DNA-3-methyladenine glycosylase 2 family protein [Scytonema hofmannii FACHB-248]